MHYRSGNLSLIVKWLEPLVEGDLDSFPSGNEKAPSSHSWGVLFKHGRPALGLGFDVTVLLLNIIKKREWIYKEKEEEEEEEGNRIMETAGADITHT